MSMKFRNLKDGDLITADAQYWDEYDESWKPTNKAGMFVSLSSVDIYRVPDRCDGRVKVPWVAFADKQPLARDFPILVYNIHTDRVTTWGLRSGGTSRDGNAYWVSKDEVIEIIGDNLEPPVHMGLPNMSTDVPYDPHRIELLYEEVLDKVADIKESVRKLYKLIEETKTV